MGLSPRFPVSRAPGLSFKEKAITAGAVGLLGLKLYGLHRFLAWRKTRQLTQQPGFRNARSFAKLPRRKQGAVLYAKRAQLNEFEGIYGSGRRHRATRAIRTTAFHFGRRHSLFG